MGVGGYCQTVSAPATRAAARRAWLADLVHLSAPMTDRHILLSLFFAFFALYLFSQALHPIAFDTFGMDSMEDLYLGRTHSILAVKHPLFLIVSVPVYQVGKLILSPVSGTLGQNLVLSFPSPCSAQPACAWHTWSSFDAVQTGRTLSHSPCSTAAAHPRGSFPAFPRAMCSPHLPPLSSYGSLPRVPIRPALGSGSWSWLLVPPPTPHPHRFRSPSSPALSGSPTRGSVGPGFDSPLVSVHS